MRPSSAMSALPRHLWLLLGVYFVASLAHFAHNAESIAFYPNMPEWLTREKVYLAWLAVSGVGLLGLFAWRLGLRVAGAVFLCAYGLLGTDGLAHYSLARSSEHTLAANFTIWFEVIAGVALALCAALLAVRVLPAHGRKTP